MTEEGVEVKIARLEEKLNAAADALKLAYANNHAIRAELLSILALLLGIYGVWKK